MDRIKKIEDVILNEGDVLVEMVTSRKSDIILTDDSLSKDQSQQFGIVVALGAAVKDLEVGDIILRTRVDKAPGYKYQGRELVLFSRYNIVVAIHKDNFDDSHEISA